MNEIIPKLFTASRGEEVVQNNPFQNRTAHVDFSLFLDRTVAARRHEKPAGSTTGIIPGDRGKVGGSWCHLPLPCGNTRGRQISPAPLAGVVTGPVQHESGAERRDANQKPQSSRVRCAGSFDPRADAVTQGVMVATAQTRTRSHIPAGQPRQKARLPNEAGRAREARQRGVSGPGKARQPPQWGGAKTASPYCKPKAT